jgi:hypothetical protein
MSAVAESLPYPRLKPVAEPALIKGVQMARSLKFGQIILTGPPGAGKSTFMRAIGGWPEEGYVDLAIKGWWRAQSLALRPREIHLGLPFVGHDASLSLFDDEWTRDWRRLQLDFGRIQYPPPKRYFFSVDWRARYAFEFILPSAETILQYRTERAKHGTHPIDEHIDFDEIRAQVDLFGRVALHFHRNGMIVHIREGVDAMPMEIDDSSSSADHALP